MILSCWPCACVFVFCEHMACLVWFYVPYALMSIVLTPSILFPDYWLICPTCVFYLPSLFAPYLISLCLQFRANLSLNVVCTWCPVLPCPALPVCFPLLGNIYIFFYFFINKAILPPAIESSPHPSHNPDSQCLNLFG